MRMGGVGTCCLEEKWADSDPPVSGPQVVGWASSKKLGRDEKAGEDLLLCEGGWRVLLQ